MNRERQKRAPIYEALEKFRRQRVVPFDVPGHKRGRGNPELVELLGERCVGIDVNSMKPLDNLCHPVSVIKEAEELAADAFGAAHAFLMVGGTTSSVQSMVLTACKPGDKIILPRNVHKSAINALVLCGAVPVYIDPKVDTDLGIPLGMEAADVRAAIEANPDAVAIFINNPTYYGICSDLRSLVELAHEHHMLALVDGKPRILNLREMIYYYLEHQKDVVTRRTRFDLDKAQARAHILEGLLKALDHIDEVISLLRASRTAADAKEGLMSRFGMDVVLAHPEGYEVMPEVEEVAKKNAEKSGGTFTKTHSMAEAFKDADIVYPKSWAPFAAMEKRTNLYAEGDSEGIKALEKELLAQNAEHKDWCCTEELMKTTKDGKALYMHCLPADINDVSCKDGEVEASVFDRYRDPLYKEASFKPYIIAAMIFLAKCKDPQATLKALEERGLARWFNK